MAMRIATWAWFSPHARVPQGAPYIFGSIQQARTAAYAANTSYWSQGRLRPTIWIGRQTSSRQIDMSRATPNHKMTSSSAILPDRSGAGRACGAEYSVFCTAQAGVHQDQKNQSNFLCNLQVKVCKTPRDGIADIQIERGTAAPPSHAQIKQSGGAPNGSPPIYKRGSSVVPKLTARAAFIDTVRASALVD